VSGQPPASRIGPSAGRILILTASIGEGHDLPARQLADDLRTESPSTEVLVKDGLRALGRPFVFVNERAPGVVFFRFRWIWDAAYWLFVHFAPTRRLTQRLVWVAGRRGLMRLVQEVEADAVVSVYPMTTEVLGRLRATGRLRVPVCAAITDLAMMHYWASPGIDLHLLTHPQSEDEVRRVAGPETAVRIVRGFTRPEFVQPCDQGAARVALGLPEGGKVVLVSGGGWGVGDLASAVDTALELDGVAAVVCLCGRNEVLRDRLQQQFAGDSRVRVEGFTERMPEWLAAGDALVHSTAGLTVLEAHMRGCPAISYGWGRGHIRANNEAFERFGIAEVAASRHELAGALMRALRARRAPDLTFATLPSAASVVLALLSSLQ
jgi:UDP-N-acetylglucosamine:LPS N-acetylglucosamine transferase